MPKMLAIAHVDSSSPFLANAVRGEPAMPVVQQSLRVQYRGKGPRSLSALQLTCSLAHLLTTPHTLHTLTTWEAMSLISDDPMSKPHRLPHLLYSEAQRARRIGSASTHMQQDAHPSARPTAAGASRTCSASQVAGARQRRDVVVALCLGPRLLCGIRLRLG